MSTHLRAVIWDFDGTLVDTRHRHLTITRCILAEIGQRDPDDIHALSGIEPYEEAIRRSSHWRDLYVHEFGLTPEATEEAGRRWEEANLREAAPSSFFEGVQEVLDALGQTPHGIVSQNSSQIIDTTLDRSGLRGYFETIIGHEDVHHARQKPHPEGLLLSLERLSLMESAGEGDVVLYIGDHEVDTRCAHHTNLALEDDEHPLRVRSIGAFYGPGHPTGWELQPDHAAHEPSEILRVATSLSPTGC